MSVLTGHAEMRRSAGFTWPVFTISFDAVVFNQPTADQLSFPLLVFIWLI
jgi:hypothetical protein